MQAVLACRQLRLTARKRLLHGLFLDVPSPECAEATNRAIRFLRSIFRAVVELCIGFV